VAAGEPLLEIAQLGKVVDGRDAAEVEPQAFGLRLDR
jgi:hypothetical protein